MVAEQPDLTDNFPLSPPLTTMIGREREVGQVRTMLCQDDVRLLTITGPGGVGKTRLALAAAAAVADTFTAGVRFLPLSDLHSHHLVATTLAQAFGVREMEELTRAERSHPVARDIHLLLLIDNFEHLLPAGPLMSALLASCPRLTILVTSRERLRLSGERILPLSPLACPNPDHMLSLERISAFPAVQLFTERALATDPAFALAETNASAIAAICHRLDGLPLALELAAARIPSLPPAALLARLARRLPMLTTGPRDVPARLRTMRNAIAWSYDLLLPEEQSLFRRLAIFAGGFTLAAAETVVDIRSIAGTDSPASISQPGSSNRILDGIVSLVDKSLVQRVDQPARGEAGLAWNAAPRFSMLETIRELGLEYLVAAGEEADTRTAHAAYYLALADDVAFRESTDGHGFDQLETEHANLRATLTWACENEAPGIAIRLAAQLGRFWLHRGFQIEGRSWLERALAKDSTAEPALRSTALNALGHLLRDLGEPAEAKRSFEVAHDLACMASDRRSEATALAGLSALSDDVGDDATTKLLGEASVAIWRELGDQRGLARGLHNLAWAEVGMGLTSAATILFHDSLEHAREAGDHRAIGHALNSLGNLCARLGQFEKARTLLEDSLSIARTARDPTEMAETLGDLGWLTMELGDIDSARVYFSECLDLLHGLEHGRLAVFAIEGCAVLAAVDQLHVPAVRLVGATVSMRQALGIPVEDDPRLRVNGSTVTGTILQQLIAESSTVEGTLPNNVFGEAAHLISAKVHYSDTPVTDPLQPLTPRERDVFELLTQGQTDRQIAKALFISRRTASKHVSSILGKLGTTNRTEATALLLREPGS